MFIKFKILIGFLVSITACSLLLNATTNIHESKINSSTIYKNSNSSKTSNIKRSDYNENHKNLGNGRLNDSSTSTDNALKLLSNTYIKPLGGWIREFDNNPNIHIAHDIYYSIKQSWDDAKGDLLKINLNGDSQLEELLFIINIVCGAGAGSMGGLVGMFFGALAGVAIAFWERGRINKKVHEIINNIIGKVDDWFASNEANFIQKFNNKINSQAAILDNLALKNDLSGKTKMNLSDANDELNRALTDDVNSIWDSFVKPKVFQENKVAKLEEKNLINEKLGIGPNSIGNMLFKNPKMIKHFKKDKFINLFANENQDLIQKITSNIQSRTDSIASNLINFKIPYISPGHSEPENNPYDILYDIMQNRFLGSDTKSGFKMIVDKTLNNVVGEFQTVSTFEGYIHELLNNISDSLGDCKKGVTKFININDAITTIWGNNNTGLAAFVKDFFTNYSQKIKVIKTDTEDIIDGGGANVNPGWKFNKVSPNSIPKNGGWTSTIIINSAYNSDDSKVDNGNNETWKGWRIPSNGASGPTYKKFIYPLLTKNIGFNAGSDEEEMVRGSFNFSKNYVLKKDIIDNNKTIYSKGEKVSIEQLNSDNIPTKIAQNIGGGLLNGSGMQFPAVATSEFGIKIMGWIVVHIFFKMTIVNGAIILNMITDNNDHSDNLVTSVVRELIGPPKLNLQFYVKNK